MGQRGRSLGIGIVTFFLAASALAEPQAADPRWIGKGGDTPILANTPHRRAQLDRSPEPDPSKRRHDGFYLRGGIGPALASYEGSVTGHAEDQGEGPLL